MVIINLYTIKDFMKDLQGFKFGFIDNIIVAIFAILGISMEKYFTFLGEYGALYGALIGHTLSDTFAGYIDFGPRVALNMGLGCLSVVVIVYVFLRIYDFKL